MTRYAAIPTLAALALACTTSDDSYPEIGGPDDPNSWHLTEPADLLPPPSPVRDMQLTHTDAILGGTVDFVLTGAGVAETAYFVRGTGGFGAGPCIPEAGGRCLDLLGPGVVLLGTAITDAAGTAVLTVPVPAGAPVGLEVSVQALIIRGLGGVDSLVSDPVAATVADPAQGWCTGSTAAFGGSTYAFCDNDATWIGARNSCTDLGMHMLTINDAAENSWVASTAGTGHWWMGYTDQVTESFFEWEDGSPAFYLNWATGEPNDANGNEDCGEIYANTGVWNDDDCASAQPYVCETETGTTCQGTLDTFDGSTYAFCTDVQTWSAARASCQAMGMELASVTDAAENAFLADLGAVLSPGTRWWLGLTDQVSENVYQWTDGTPLWFTHWNVGQPDNASDEDCVELNHSVAREWNDRPCSDAQAYICEF